MRRRLAAICGALLAACAVMPAASADDHKLDVPRFPVAPQWAFNGVYPVDPPADNLISAPQVGTKGLLALASQTNSVCSAYELIDADPSPRPDRIAELYRYATQYVNVINTIDPRSRVRNPASTNSGSTIQMPALMATAFQLQKQEMFAYAARLQYTATLFNMGQITAAEAARRANLALVRLIGSGFVRVDHVLTATRTLFC